ncbi:hypothetical protein U9M48_041617 [Paspalum notatum var. saurae]|uniref:Uncharacterized protein n=1 Tax=Paspalum notatum var. saurae TaxID=547442 RepID=A0AAQ3UPM1_PASNO
MPTLTNLSTSSTPGLPAQNVLMSVMLEIADMGVTSSPSVTMYVTTPLTYPPLSSSAAAEPQPAAAGAAADGSTKVTLLGRRILAFAARRLQRPGLEQGGLVGGGEEVVGVDAVHAPVQPPQAALPGEMSFTTVLMGRVSRLKRKSTNSLLASANSTFFALLSTRSFSEMLVDAIAEWFWGWSEQEVIVIATSKQARGTTMSGGLLI